MSLDIVDRFIVSRRGVPQASFSLDSLLSAESKRVRSKADPAASHTGPMSHRVSLPPVSRKVEDVACPCVVFPARDPGLYS